MKKLLLFIFTLLSIQVFGQRTPALEMLTFPKYMEGNSGARGEERYGIPYVYRAKITGLAPQTTYRYINNVVSFTDQNTGVSPLILPPGNVPPGTPGYIAGNFFMPPIPDGQQGNGGDGSLLTRNYGQLTTDNTGSYTGWFIQETSDVNGSQGPVFLRISLNDPTAADPTEIAYQLHSPDNQPLLILGMSPRENFDLSAATYGTAIRSTPATSGIPKNFVFLYDNIEGTGRPVAGTFIEDDGVASALSSGLTGLAPFYYNNVNGVNGAWGAMVVNNDPNGIRRIEQRSLADGSLVGYNTSADGTWANGASPGTTVTTASVQLGTDLDGTSIVLDGSVVTLGAVKTPQTVTFTNTFPATFKVGDPDFTLSASSSAGLTAFQYSAAPAGILEITGNTVKIVGGGTAVITVTEPGNATTAAGTATKSITVDASPQVITGLPQTLTATYGDANIVLAATGGASGNAVVYTSDNTAIAEITAGNQMIIKKAGAVVIRANQAGNANYSPAPEVTSTLTIAKVSLDVIAEDKFKVQGGDNPEATFVYGTFKGTDDATSVTGTPVLTIAADANSAPGIYDITVDVTGLVSEKYTFNPVKGKLTIEAKKDQVITFTDFSSSAVYGSQSLSFQVSSNTVNPITFSSSNSNAAVVEKNTIGEWTVRIVGAGEADITASQAGDAAYLPGFARRHISISKASLNIIAEDKAKLTGEADPVFTARYEGFVNDDDANKLTGTLQFTTQVNGGSSLIIPSGLTSNNYVITFVNGTLTEGSVAFAAINKIYGDVPFNPGARSLSGASVVYTVADPAIATVNISGLVEIKGTGTTTVTANFTSGETATAALHVDQKAVTVTANPQTRVYAQANPQLTVSYTGLVYNETPAVITTQPEVTTTATQASPVGKYAITASGAVAQNYKFSYQPNIMTVTQAALVVKADDKSKLYGQENPALTLSYLGLAAQDNGAALNLQTVVSTTATAAAKVDTYPVTVTGLTTAANYTISYAGGNLSVTPAPLNVKADDVDRAQGQPNPVFTFTYTGFVNGDQASNLVTPAVATTTATQSSPKGIYPITVSGAASPNYAVTFTNGQISVKNTQTVVFNELPASVYGDAVISPVASSETGIQPVFTSDNLSVAIIENGKVRIVGAGTANITATFAATDDLVASVISRSLVVAKRLLVVRSDSKTKLYGLANPVFTATYDGFVNGETVSTAISAQAILTTTATPLSPVGTYPVTGSAASARNYNITYEAGILTIDKAVLTVTADNKTRGFGLDNPAFTLRYTGFVNAESASVIENPPVAVTVAGLDAPAGTYPIVASGGSDENYNFSYVDGVLTVTSTTRTITMDDIAVKFVGDADFVPNVVLTSGEVPVFTSSDAAIATIVNNKIHVVGAGNVTITATAPASANYSTTPSVSKLLIVSKVTQTISFDAVPALKNDGASYTLKAVSSSGLPVTFKVSDPSYVSISGDVIKGLRIGSVQITATQAGDNRYAAAKLVSQNVLVADADGVGIKVHAALSINGDGMNEFLTIDGIKDFPLNKVTIINRNGLKVFDVEGYDNDQHVFVGKSKSGVLLPQGTYFCLIEYNIDSKLKRKTGYFILKY
jgi:hypothetical protein